MYCVLCCNCFTDDDRLLGYKPHNHPLFVCSYINDHILIDGGSVVNIVPKSTIEKLGRSVGDLSYSRLTIQGFN